MNISNVKNQRALVPSGSPSTLPGREAHNVTAVGLAPVNKVAAHPPQGASSSTPPPIAPSRLRAPMRPAAPAAQPPRLPPLLHGPRGSVRSTALQGLVRHLVTDENFALAVAKAPHKALGSVSYLSANEKSVLKGSDPAHLKALADAAMRYAEQARVVGQIDGVSVDPSGGRGNLPPWVLGGYGDFGDSAMYVPSWAGAGSSGNVGDPFAPYGHRAGGTDPGGGGPSTSPYGPSGASWSPDGGFKAGHGSLGTPAPDMGDDVRDPTSLERGFGIDPGPFGSGALPPSLWKVLHPGGEVSDDTGKGDAGKGDAGKGDAGKGDAGKDKDKQPAEVHMGDPADPPGHTPAVPPPKNPMNSGFGSGSGPDSSGNKGSGGSDHGLLDDVLQGAALGAAGGVGLKLFTPGHTVAEYVAFASYGAVIGAALGGIRHVSGHLPPDDASGGGGPRQLGASISRAAHELPPDDSSGGAPSGPRARVASRGNFDDFMPPPDAAGGNGPTRRDFLPNPESGSPGNPHSRALTALTSMTQSLSRALG